MDSVSSPLETVGLHHAPGYRVPLGFQTGEGFNPHLGVGSRLRLVWVSRGSGTLHWGSGTTPFQGPVLLCLDETEDPRLDHLVDVEVETLFFHPSAVNGGFTFESIRGPLESTAAQDRDWLWAFVQSRPEAPGLLNLGPTSQQQVAQLMATLRRELVQQPDSYWPCRARSYLLELLILIDRLFMAPAGLESPGPAPLPLAEAGSGTKTAEVLVYLHSHYAEDLSLRRLCEAFHTNHTSLTQQFRRDTGVSIVAYLVQLRLRVASSILRDTTLPIGEIVERVGFRDATHFGRTFRRHLGSTPSEYCQRYYRETVG